MAQITASFPFKHPKDDRWVKVGETLDVDDELARQKIADGHASSMVISPDAPEPSFVTDFVADPQPIQSQNTGEETPSGDNPEPVTPASDSPPSVGDPEPVAAAAAPESSPGGGSKPSTPTGTTSTGKASKKG